MARATTLKIHSSARAVGAVAGLFLSAAAVVAQSEPQPLDGTHRVLHDDLLENLVGDWKVSGLIQGKSADVNLQASWALNHQFLHLHEKSIATVPERVPYDAEIYIGYDNASDRYVVHWIDVFGGRFSETLGYGVRSGDSIRFTFEYPDGPFHNTFTWDPQKKLWHFYLEQKDSNGEWKMFADQTAARVR